MSFFVGVFATVNGIFVFYFSLSPLLDPGIQQPKEKDYLLNHLYSHITLSYLSLYFYHYINMLVIDVKDYKPVF